MAKSNTAEEREDSTSEPMDGHVELMDRMRAVEDKLEMLLNAFLVPDVPKEIKAKGLRRRMAPFGSPETAQRARVGRLAKRHGMTFHEWVARYGMVERLPGSEQQETLPGVSRRKRRRKG